MNQSKAEWIPDVQCSCCEGCGARFRFLLRRHHCRRCGRVFCDSCSKEKVRGLPGYEDTLERICNSCKQEMRTLREVGKKRPRERKICIVGSPGAGEAPLLNLLCPDTTNNENKTMTFAKTRQMSTSGEFEYVFSVLDAGQIGCDMFQPQYTIGTHAYVLLFCISDRNSFLSLLPVRDRILECSGLEKVMMLVGNKPTGVTDRFVTEEEIVHLARRWSIPFMELSTSKQWQIDELKNRILRAISDVET